MGKELRTTKETKKPATKTPKEKKACSGSYFSATPRPGT